MMDKINELLNEATKIDKEVNGEKEIEKRERELMEEEITITKEKVRQWLGTSNQLEEAIEVIYEIAIGEYSTEMLNQDIIEYYMGNWEYKEGNNEEK